VSGGVTPVDVTAAAGGSREPAALDRPTRAVAAPGGPLRILVLAPSFPFPPAHGGAVRLYHSIRGLAARGHHVVLAALVDEAPDPAHLGEMARWCREVRVVPRTPSPSPRPVRLFAFRKYYVDAMALAIRDLERRHRFDVIHLDYTQMGVYHDALPRGIPRVLVEVDVSFMTVGRRARGTRGWRRVPALARTAATWWAELFLARRVDRVFTMSEVDARLLRRFLPRLATTVVPNGVDVRAEPYVEGRAPGATLLFVGYFRHLPNVDAALAFAAATYPRIRAAAPDAEWLVVGAHPPDSIRALATPGSGITVAGYVEELGPCFERSAVFVCPVTRGSGTRVKVLQAMARGLPVVTTTLGAEGLDVMPERDVLIGDDPPAFAAQVVRLLRDRALGERLRRQARRLVEERYDHGRLVETLEAGYRAALGGRTAR